MFDSTYYVFGSNIYTASVNNDGEVVYDFAGYFSDGISEGTIDNGNPVRCMTIIKHTVGINSNYKITYEFKNI